MKIFGFLIIFLTLMLSCTPQQNVTSNEIKLKQSFSTILSFLSQNDMKNIKPFIFNTNNIGDFLNKDAPDFEKNKQELWSSLNEYLRITIIAFMAVITLNRENKVFAHNLKNIKQENFKISYSNSSNPAYIERFELAKIEYQLDESKKTLSATFLLYKKDWKLVFFDIID